MRRRGAMDNVELDDGWGIDRTTLGWSHKGGQEEHVSDGTKTASGFRWMGKTKSRLPHSTLTRPHRPDQTLPRLTFLSLPCDPRDPRLLPKLERVLAVFVRPSRSRDEREPTAMGDRRGKQHAVEGSRRRMHRGRRKRPRTARRGAERHSRDG